MRVNNIKIIHGNPIQSISERITLAPHSLKKFPMPMGETFIGRQGKKYLELSKGEKNATPSPPLVRASKILCEAVHKKK